MDFGLVENVEGLKRRTGNIMGLDDGFIYVTPAGRITRDKDHHVKLGLD